MQWNKNFKRKIKSNINFTNISFDDRDMQIR